METTVEEQWSQEQLIERARELARVFREEADGSEQARQPTPSAVDALVESGVLRMLVPRVYGGLELDLGDFLEVGLILGEADASLAWVASFLIEHAWWFTQFPEPFQKEIFASGSTVCAAGVIAPTGRAEAVPGGFRVSGRWGWASGSTCSDWLIAGALTGEAEGRPDIALAAVPMADVIQEDTWHVDGMCGTGSGDVVLEDVFVPSDRVIPFRSLLDGHGPGAQLHEGPLYRTPAYPILLTAVTSTALGQAREALRGFREEITSKVRGMGPPEREKPAAQMRLARATTELHKAELLLHDVIRDVEEKRDDATGQDRCTWGVWMSEVCHVSRRVVLDLAKAAGASAHFRAHPLQRTVRDLGAMCSHVALNEDAQHENLGRLLLGLRANVALF